MKDYRFGIENGVYFLWQARFSQGCKLGVLGVAGLVQGIGVENGVTSGWQVEFGASELKRVSLWWQAGLGASGLKTRCP